MIVIIQTLNRFFTEESRQWRIVIKHEKNKRRSKNVTFLNSSIIGLTFFSRRWKKGLLELQQIAG